MTGRSPVGRLLHWIRRSRSEQESIVCHLFPLAFSAMMACKSRSLPRISKRDTASVCLIPPLPVREPSQNRRVRERPSAQAFSLSCRCLCVPKTPLTQIPLRIRDRPRRESSPFPLPRQNSAAHSPAPLSERFRVADRFPFPTSSARDSRRRFSSKSPRRSQHSHIIDATSPAPTHPPRSRDSPIRMHRHHIDADTFQSADVLPFHPNVFPSPPQTATGKQHKLHTRSQEADT